MASETITDDVQQLTTELYEEAADFFGRVGPLPTAWDEVRRHPRFYYRSCADAVIYPQDPMRPVPDSCIVLTRDLSRGGMSLVHTEPVSPGQRIGLTLNGEAQRMLEVLWCRQASPKNYILGCRFIKAD